jgi:ATP-dependent helicase/nuclease subunit A
VDIGDGGGGGQSAADAVTVMSIHKSKGLEFPVVFVCGLGRKFNLSDARAKFVKHRDFGFGTVSVDLDNRVKTPTLNHYAIKRKLHRESLSEELRVLYVALTRAKAKLILTGTANPAARPIRQPHSAQSFMDWILMALPHNNGVFSVFHKSKTDISIAEQKKAEKNTEMVELLQDFYYNDNYGFEYPMKLLRYVPSKISVTEVKRLFYREFTGDSAELDAWRAEPLDGGITFAEPSFISQKDRNLAVRRGVIVHAVLERIDFAKNRTAADIRALLGEMEAKSVLREGESRHVNVPSVAAFLSSPLAERIRRSPFVRKESRFVSSISPSALDPEWRGIDGKPVMLHGVIDLVFEEDGEMVVVDYKTDRIQQDGGERAHAERYRLQLSLYKQAVEKYYGKNVKETVLYFFETNVDVII